MTTIRHQRMIVPLAPGWEDKSQIIITKKANKKRPSDFRPNIVIVIDTLREGESFEEFKTRQLGSLRKVFQDLVIEQDCPASCGPWRGYKREYHFSMNDRLVKQGQFLLCDGSEVYSFTCSDLPTSFEGTWLELDQIVSQFRIV
jgi:hypothetical protein